MIIGQTMSYATHFRVCEICHHVWDASLKNPHTCPTCHLPVLPNNSIDVNSEKQLRMFAHKFLLEYSKSPFLYVDVVKDYARYLLNDDITMTHVCPMDMSAQELNYSNVYRLGAERAPVLLFRILFIENPVLAIHILGPDIINLMIKTLRDIELPFIEDYLRAAHYHNFLQSAKEFMSSKDSRHNGLFGTLQKNFYRVLMSPFYSIPELPSTPVKCKNGIETDIRYAYLAHINDYKYKVLDKDPTLCKFCKHPYIAKLDHKNDFQICVRCGEIVCQSYDKFDDFRHSVKCRRKFIGMMYGEINDVSSNYRLDWFKYNHYNICSSESNFHPSLCILEANKSTHLDMHAKPSSQMPPHMDHHNLWSPPGYVFHPFHYNPIQFNTFQAPPPLDLRTNEILTIPECPTKMIHVTLKECTNQDTLCAYRQWIRPFESMTHVAFCAKPYDNKARQPEQGSSVKEEARPPETPQHKCTSCGRCGRKKPL